MGWCGCRVWTMWRSLLVVCGIALFGINVWVLWRCGPGPSNQRVIVMVNATVPVAPSSGLDSDTAMCANSADVIYKSFSNLTPGTQVLHVISHTHWDREWYLPIESQRSKLVHVIDTVLEAAQASLNSSAPVPISVFRSFLFDGQVLPLLDYLEVRPKAAILLSTLAQCSRISIGPMYIQPDEFLVSGESLVRNFLFGSQWSSELVGNQAAMSKVAYLIDSFGHTSQMPQIAQGFGIDSIIVMRGLRPSVPSESLWRSPDGSAALLIRSKYCSMGGTPNPRSPDDVYQWFSEKIEKQPQHVTPHLLGLNGCDHTALDPYVLDGIHTANTHNGGISGVTVTHSNIDAYTRLVWDWLKSTQGHLPSMGLSVVEGELTHSISKLVGTWTIMPNQKRQNWECEALLTKWAEPFLSWASVISTGHTYDHDRVNYAWKLLLQNHPHDTICGCNVPAVHSEVDNRLMKCKQFTAQLTDEALINVINHIDFTIQHENDSNHNITVPVVVFNALPFPRKDVPVVVSVDFDPMSTFFDHFSPPIIRVLDWNGNIVPSQILQNMGLTWDYMLPDLGFRKPFSAQRRLVLFSATVPSLGYSSYTFELVPRDIPAHNRTYFLGNTKGYEPNQTFVDPPFICDQSGIPYFSETIGVLDNGLVHIRVLKNGEVDIFDLDTTECYTGLNYIIFEGDEGSEYEFISSSTRTFNLVNARIVYQHSNSILSQITVEADAFSNESPNPRTTFTICYVLFSNSHHLGVRVSLTNRLHNTRVRAKFPIPAYSEVMAGSAFDFVNRTWHLGPQSLQGMIDCYSPSTRSGIALVSKGLYEYEVSGLSVELTLFRSVGEMQDWGQFFTPSAQNDGTILAFEYAIFPHQHPIFGAGALQSQLIEEFFSFLSPPAATQARIFTGRTLSHPIVDLSITGSLFSCVCEPLPSTKTSRIIAPPLTKLWPPQPRTGPTLPPTMSFLTIKPSNLVLSAIKGSPSSAGINSNSNGSNNTNSHSTILVRVYNPLSFDLAGSIHLGCGLSLASVEKCSLNETCYPSPDTPPKETPVPPSQCHQPSFSFSFPAPAKKILTWKLQLKYIDQ
ncbi:glycosyl hydrolase family 38 [Pelomyxa schiedti]|nr:glycosyl hydrolase family 38 [Pelomyxa schiedti]